MLTYTLDVKTNEYKITVDGPHQIEPLGRLKFDKYTSQWFFCPQDDGVHFYLEPLLKIASKIYELNAAELRIAFKKSKFSTLN